MFYGLYAAAEPSFAAERRGPVLFAALKDLGYRFEVLSSLSLAVSNFRRTVFVDVQDAIADDLPGPRARDKDRQITERFEAFLAARTDERPFFTVALMQSTHSGYDFDEATAAYRPYAAWVGFRGLGEGERRLRVYNRYRNAVHYADSLVGTMLDALARRGVLDDTIVLVTGDHGEEFNEHGYWGHNGAFTPEQVHVPLVLHLPGIPAGRHAGLTSHHDLPATLLCLVLGNVALMLADATGYLSVAGPAGALGWAFVAVAMVAQIATANLLVVLPLLVVSQLGRGDVLAGLLAPLFLTCLQLLVYIDR